MLKINDVVYAGSGYEPMIPKGTPGIVIDWWYDFPNTFAYPVVDFSNSLGPNYSRYEMRPEEISVENIVDEDVKELQEELREKRIAAFEELLALYVGHKDYPILSRMLNDLRNS